MSQIVKSTRYSRPIPRCLPAFLPVPYRLAGICVIGHTTSEAEHLVLTLSAIALRRENKIVGLASGEPLCPEFQDCANALTEGDHPALAVLRLRVSDPQLVSGEVKLV